MGASLFGFRAWRAKQLQTVWPLLAGEVGATGPDLISQYARVNKMRKAAQVTDLLGFTSPRMRHKVSFLDRKATSAGWGPLSHLTTSGSFQIAARSTLQRIKAILTMLVTSMAKTVVEVPT